MIELIEKSKKTAAEFFYNFLLQENINRGFLQKVDSRIKILSIVVFILLSVLSTDIAKVLALTFAGLILARLSQIGLFFLIKRVWLFTFFSFLIVLPVGILEKDFYYVAFFTLKVFSALIFLQLLILTTPFNEILQGLRFFKIPETFVFIVGLIYRYLHLMFSELLRIIVARESRRIKAMNFKDIWEHGGRALGNFFIRSLERGERLNLTLTYRGNTIKTYSHSLQFSKFEILLVVYTLIVTVWWSLL